jgi:hypothetical protein
MNPYEPYNSLAQFVPPSAEQLAEMPENLQVLFADVKVAHDNVVNTQAELKTIDEALRESYLEARKLDETIEKRCAKLTPDMLRKQWVDEQNQARRAAHGLQS